MSDPVSASAYLPVRLGELVALVPHVCVARGIPRYRGTGLVLACKPGVVPDTIGSCPVTTESCVDDVEVVVEEFVRVASVGYESCDGESPAVRVGLLVGDVGGDGISGEPEDLDTGLGPDH
jgi:hypothetical protein